MGHAINIENVQHELLDANIIPLDRQATAEQMRDCIAAAIKKLRPAYRKVFVMSLVEGKTRREIAAAVGASEKRIDKRMTKALKICRAYLAAVGMDTAHVFSLLATLGLLSAAIGG